MWTCEVFTFGLGRRGLTRWQASFKRLFVAYWITRIVAIYCDWFGGVDSSLGIAWEIKRPLSKD